MKVTALYLIGTEGSLFVHTVKPIDCPPYTAGYISVMFGDEHGEFPTLKRIHGRRRQGGWE